jgi:hypothetical protein
MHFISLRLLKLSLILATLRVLGPIAAAAGEETLLSQLREGANVLGNGSFIWDGYRGKSVTVTTVGVPIGSIPKHWYGGPGVGATAIYDIALFWPGQTDVPGSPKWHLRIDWAKPPSADWPGEDQHKPQFRCTVLENFSMADVRRFAGKTMLVRCYARVQRGPLAIIPILWHSYDSQTRGVAAVKGKGYELFESSGHFGQVAISQGRPRPEAIWHLTDRWQKFEKLITLPAVGPRFLTPDNYTGCGFDVVERAAPVLDIAAVEVRPAEPVAGRDKGN